MDAIQDDKEGAREPYIRYGEWASDAGNAEVRHMRKSYKKSKSLMAYMS